MSFCGVATLTRDRGAEANNWKILEWLNDLETAGLFVLRERSLAIASALAQT